MPLSTQTFDWHKKSCTHAGHPHAYPGRCTDCDRPYKSWAGHTTLLTNPSKSINIIYPQLTPLNTTPLLLTTESASADGGPSAISFAVNSSLPAKPSVACHAHSLCCTIKRPYSAHRHLIDTRSYRCMLGTHKNRLTIAETEPSWRIWANHQSIRRTHISPAPHL